MANLKYNDKKAIKNAFQMREGNVLNFSNKSLQEFMNDFDVDLNLEKYSKNGSSKAKRLTSFFELESDSLVSSVLKEMLNYAKTNKPTDLTKDLESSLEEIIDKLNVNGATKKKTKDKLDSNKFQLFLSHSSEDKEIAHTIKDKLSLYGIDCFVAHDDIEPDAEWQNEIKTFLYKMDGLVAIISEYFNRSHWTHQEIGVAIGKDIKIISMKIDETDPIGFIASKQAIKYNENCHLDIIKILMDKNKNKSYEKMFNSYIIKLNDTNQFDTINELGRCLEFIKKLNDEQIKSLVKVCNENDAIQESWCFIAYFMKYLQKITGIEQNNKTIINKIGLSKAWIEKNNKAGEYLNKCMNYYKNIKNYPLIMR